MLWGSNDFRLREDFENQKPFDEANPDVTLIELSGEVRSRR